MNLYHGSTYEFRQIDLNEGKGYKDFGKGFYATARKEHADNIAKRNKRILESRYNKQRMFNNKLPKKVFIAYCYNLVFNENCTGLNVKIFKNADIEWVKFILINRKNNYTQHNYDIVIGPTADEETTTILADYEPILKNNMSDEVLNELIKKLKPENLPKQYFFATQRAIEKTLIFRSNWRDIVR